MKKKVAVLMGGPSSERGISLRSGKAVCEALRGTMYEPVAIDVVDEWEDTLKDTRPSVAFIALHGKFGEDGTVQAILEDMNILYTGSGVKASRLAIDKIASKKLFQKVGISVPEYCIFTKSLHKPVNSKFELPVVVKPSSQGSSIGLTIAEDESQLKKALELAYVFDEFVIIERFIKGKELTVGILEERPLPVINIVPGRKFYDYKAKYISNQTQYLVPAPLEPRLYKLAQELGLAAHNELGCRDFSRVDMILGEDDIIRVLEVNSIPGLTEKSLLPKAAAVAGIGFKMLCVKLVELAIKDGGKKR